MAMTRTNPNTGEITKIPPREMKETIMQAFGWTDDEYRRQYDIFKNKLRFYEEMQRSRGIDIETQSPVELLYKAALAKMNYGDEYEPSLIMQEIMATTAHSISKGRRIARNPETRAYQNQVSKIIELRFGRLNEAGGFVHGDGFINFYSKAREIMERITNPVDQEEALKKFAEYIHVHYPREGKDKRRANVERGAGGVRSGETYGSDYYGDVGTEFDLTPWLI